MRISSKLRMAGVLAAWCALMPLAQAHGPHGYYRWGGYYDPWVAPLVFGAAVGTAVYVSRPVVPSTVVITSPPVVVANPVTVPVQATEAYFCRESGQYFPTVQTCPSPWLVVYPR
ncbi:MAG: hypothetical protein RLY90_960 [Pseudomonadota bacterium]|jgi:hypothetical protein